MSWQTTKLENLFDVGSAKRVLKAQWQSEGVPFYRGREITKLSSQGYVDNELFITEELYSEYKDKYGVPAVGDIMITAIGTIGNSYIVKEDDKFYYKDASVLCLKKTSDVDSRFIDYWLKSTNMRCQLSEGNGATVDTLTITKMKSLNIALPSLLEQKRIVAILDEAFAGIDQAIANTEKNLASARELFESYLNTIFTQKGEGWKMEAFEGCFRLKSGDGLTSKAMVAGKYQVYGGNGVAGTHNESNLSGDNVIIGRVGALCGNARHIKDEIWLTDNAFKIIDKKYNFDNSFLTYLLNFKNLRSYARQSAQPVISNSSLKSVVLNFPTTVEEQVEIVSKLDALKFEVRQIELIYEQKLSALNELKQSLLQKAFSGELTADMADEAQAEAAA